MSCYEEYARLKESYQDLERNYKNVCETVQKIQALVGDGVLNRVKELKEKAGMYDNLG